ncbi:MAG: PKD domain-containing protein, partial [Candidatus Thermoplasmatota archaeon]
WGLISTAGQKAAWKAWASAYSAAPPPLPPTNNPPTASFTTSGANLTWKVDGSASSDPDGNALTYAWSWGDGATSTGVSTSHSYASAGTFTVTLTVNDGQAKSSANRTMTATAPPPPPAFTATFAPSNGNEWWIQTAVSANKPLASVCVAINGGACQALKLQSWGAWAASYNAKTGSTVRFTAKTTSGESMTTGAYNWPSGTPAASTPPPPPSFSATFAPYGGNNWWVQTKVTGSAPIAGVCASVNGGACQALKHQSWGAWAASYNAPTGSKVVFKATSTTGATATSAAYTWPVA